jgi:pilus assembly protein CpaC
MTTKLRFTMLLALAGLLICPPAWNQAIAQNPILPHFLQLEVGESSTLIVDNASKVSVGNPSVVSTRPLDANDLQVTGLGEGNTQLVYLDAKGQQQTVNVLVTPPLQGVARDIRSLLAGVPNVRVMSVANRVVIDGKLLTPEDLDRVEKVASGFGGNVLNLAVFDRGPSNEAIADFIRRMSGVETVKVNILGQTAYLSGTVNTSQQKANVVTLAKTQIANVVDMIEIKPLMIETEILFLKVSKNGGFNIGYNLFDGSGDGLKLEADAQGKQSYVANTWSTMDVGLQWSATLKPKINILVNNGDAAILARPRIGTRNGEKGDFHSGGEYYYEVSGVQAANLQSVEFGLILSVQPTLIGNDEVVNVVSVTVSVPVSNSGSQQLSLDKYSNDNTVVCKLGQSIVLSGLLQNLRNYYRSATPLLGRIPLLSLFFSNKTRNDQDTELIAIITPRILNASDSATPIIVKDNISENMEKLVKKEKLSVEKAVSREDDEDLNKTYTK